LATTAHLYELQITPCLAILTGNYGYICDDILHLRATLSYIMGSFGFAFGVLVLKFLVLGDELDLLDGIEDGWLVQFKVVTLLVLGFSLTDRD
jgi:hypothetical protein